MLNNKSHMNGFLLGNQKLLARTAMREERQKRAPKTQRGSWWVGVPAEKFSDACKQAFPDMAESKEGQRPAMMNFSR